MMVNSKTLSLQKGNVRYVIPVTSAMSCILAHLSQRLTGELKGYPWSGVRRRPFTISNVYSSETAWPIKTKFYVEPPWQAGKKVYINGPGHMTKMTAMPIYIKNLLLQIHKSYYLETWHVASGTQALQSLYR